MLDWIKKKLKRRIIHNEPECYKCGWDGIAEDARNDVSLIWHREKTGWFTYEEGYLCPKCEPKKEEAEPPFTIEFQEVPLSQRPPVDIEQMKKDWIEYVKEFEGVEDSD